MNYYEFLESSAARMLHFLPRTVVLPIMAHAGRRGLLSNADFLPEVIEATGVATGQAAKGCASSVLAGLGRYYADIGTLMHGSEWQIKKTFVGKVRVAGIHNWKSLEGKPFIVYSAHFACFYIAAFAEDILDKITIIRRFHSNGRDVLIERLRMLTGKDLEVVGLTDPSIGLKLVKRLKSGRPVSGMMDYSYTDTTTFITNFMGRASATPAGLTIIAAKMNIPLLPFFILRDEYSDGYVVQIGDPLYPDTSIESTAAAFELTTQINQKIEQIIRAHPTQWTFWPSLPGRWAFADSSLMSEEEIVEAANDVPD